MSRISTIAFSCILGLIMSGCGTTNSQQSINPTPSTSPVATTPQPTPSVNPVNVNPSPPVIVSSASGLIQSTNANQRAKQVQKGRKDPFAKLVAPAYVSVSSNTQSRQNIVPQLPTFPGNTSFPQGNVGSGYPISSNRGRTNVTVNRGRSTTTVTPGSSSSSRRRPTTTVAIQNPNIPNTRPSNPNTGTPGNQASVGQPNSFPPDLPPGTGIEPTAPLEPDVAKNVTISGVVQVGDQIQAIVKVPNEGASRYVSVGQSLANGQVLVKRIEMNEGSEPIVILEQYGIEVSKAIGEVAAPSQPGTPTASVISVPLAPQAAKPTSAISSPPPPPNNALNPGA